MLICTTNVLPAQEILAKLSGSLVPTLCVGMHTGAGRMEKHLYVPRFVGVLSELFHWWRDRYAFPRVTVGTRVEGFATTSFAVVAKGKKCFDVGRFPKEADTRTNHHAPINGNPWLVHGGWVTSRLASEPTYVEIAFHPFATTSFAGITITGKFALLRKFQNMGTNNNSQLLSDTRILLEPR